MAKMLNAILLTGSILLAVNGVNAHLARADEGKPQATQEDGEKKLGRGKDTDWAGKPAPDSGKSDDGKTEQSQGNAGGQTAQPNDRREDRQAKRRSQ